MGARILLESACANPMRLQATFMLGYAHRRTRGRCQMKIRFGAWLLAGSWLVAGAALANAPSPVSIEIVDAKGQVFREFPMNARDGALRSYLQAEKGARYQVRVRNTTGERLGLVIAVDGRNIINGSQVGARAYRAHVRARRMATRRITPAGAPISMPSTSSISPTGATRTPRRSATVPRAASSPSRCMAKCLRLGRCISRTGRT